VLAYGMIEEGIVDAEMIALLHWYKVALALATGDSFRRQYSRCCTANLCGDCWLTKSSFPFLSIVLIKKIIA
jgi:hypothetical protein